MEQDTNNNMENLKQDAGELTGAAAPENTAAEKMTYRRVSPKKKSSVVALLAILAVVLTAAAMLHVFRADVFNRRVQPVPAVASRVENVKPSVEKIITGKKADASVSTSRPETKFVAETKAAGPKPVAKAPVADSAPFAPVNLFNGRDFAGWARSGSEWSVENREIVADSDDTILSHKIKAPCTIEVLARAADEISFIRFGFSYTMGDTRAISVDKETDGYQLFRINVFEDGRIEIMRDNELVYGKKYSAARKNIYVQTTGRIFVKSVVMRPIK